MKDISTVGAYVDIKFKSGPSIHITEFSDEGTPFECPDVDLSDNRKNLNGEMISSRMPTVYPVSVTVIPGTDQDKELVRKAHLAALYKGNVTKIKDLIVEQIIVFVPNIDESAEASAVGRTYTFKNGRMKTSPTGPSSSAEGRMSARTYAFEMQDFIPPMS